MLRKNADGNLVIDADGNTNLYYEFEEALCENGASLDNVFWIGVGDKYCSLEEWCEWAKNVWYYAGVGHTQVSEGLVVAGDGFRMFRVIGDDGEESWGFEWLMVMPPIEAHPSTFVMDSSDPDYWEEED